MATRHIYRPAGDNALLAYAARAPLSRRALECAFWVLAYGVGVGALWYGALLIGVAR